MSATDSSPEAEALQQPHSIPQVSRLENDGKDMHDQQESNMTNPREINSESPALNENDAHDKSDSDCKLQTVTPTHTAIEPSFCSPEPSTIIQSTQLNQNDADLVEKTHSYHDSDRKVHDPDSNFENPVSTVTADNQSPKHLHHTTSSSTVGQAQMDVEDKPSELSQLPAQSRSDEQHSTGINIEQSTVNYYQSPENNDNMTKIQARMDVDNSSEIARLQSEADERLTETNNAPPAHEITNFNQTQTSTVDYNVISEDDKFQMQIEIQPIVELGKNEDIVNYESEHDKTELITDDKRNLSVHTRPSNSKDDLFDNKNSFPENTAMECDVMDENSMMESDSVITEKQSIDSSPKSSFLCVDKVSKEFNHSHLQNYLRGCKWSPDGTEVLTNSNDNILRTFTPTGNGGHDDQQMSPNCKMKQSGIVYDFAWYPGKTDSKPETCRIACSCPGNPIHLWDSNDGRIVSSYRAFDHCDELTSAYSLSFSHDGSKLYGGYKNSIRIFDTEYSHRACTTIKTMDTKTKEGHKGIISCFCHGTPESNTFVTGSYSRHVGVYYTLANKLVCLIQGQQGGVTHIALSPDGRKLYTGGRKDPEIVCWDMRNLGQVCCTYLRDVQTNQRIYFDLSPSGRYLVSGNHDGSLQAWDTTQPGEEMNGEMIVRPCHALQAHEDCVNGVSFHPQGVMLVTASGQRHFADVMSDDSDDDGDDDNVDRHDVKDFSLKIWSTPWF